MTEISEEQAKALVDLFGARVLAHGKDSVSHALQALLDAEHWRRCMPDPTGAFHVYALTQGPLLQREYDLSTHGHWEGWEIGAVVVDIQRLIAVNQEHGFPAGDATLRAVVESLQELYPTAKVVRIHSDAFAALLPPSAEVEMTAALETQTRAALHRRVPELLEKAGQPRLSLEYTVSLMHLTIVKPSHWQTLGPLVWAECDRAHVMARSGQASGVQRRRIVLDASVPMTTLG